MNPSADRNNEFLRELRDLLEKYNASIDWTCHWSSDLHGVTGRNMEISVDRNVVFTIDGDSVCSFDLQND